MTEETKTKRVAKQKKEKPKTKYLIKVELKNGFVYDKNTETAENEYYFEVSRKGDSQRTPTRGYFRFSEKGGLNLPSYLILYSEILRAEAGRELEIPLHFKERNLSRFKMDETMTFFKIQLKVGEKSQTRTIKEKNFELRIIITNELTHI